MFKKLTIILFLSIPLLTGCIAAINTAVIVGVDMANDRRTTGIYIEDQNIEIKISNALYKEEKFAGSTNIKVVSFNRIVLLIGQAKTQKLKSQATDIARNTNNVRKVHNEIRVLAPNSFLSGSNDSWLTTKAKSLLLTEDELASEHIKVITENSEIFLIGMVTRAEAKKAIEIVRDIDGAKRIVQVFEYTD